MTVREQARARAQEELSKAIYVDERPGLLDRAARWVLEWLADLLDTAQGVASGGWFGLLAMVALLVIVVLVVRRRAGRLARGGGREATLFLGRTRTADEHRRAADAHAAAGAWAEAVRERLRAIVRALEERALIDPRPGRTALEAAADGGAVLPGCADGLRAGAEIFDAIWYGRRPAGAEDHAALHALDRQVAAARPAALASIGPAPGAGAPVSPR